MKLFEKKGTFYQVTDHLEIDRYERVGMCPLLDGSSCYVADTVDLTRDDEAR